MKNLSYEKIIEKVAELIVQINLKLPEETKNKIEKAYRKETNHNSREYLRIILENLKTAEKERTPICQDTGLPIVFVEKGSEVKITRGHYKSLSEIINAGIEKGSKKGYLRNSVVCPISRKTTGINTPAVIHFFPAEDMQFKVTLTAKGFGSENTCRLAMLKPSDGKKGIENFIVDTVKKAGSLPCPPVFIGVGIGGSFEKSAVLSKIALCKTQERSPYRNWEKNIMKKINALRIGPAGFGGKTTVLDLKIETAPTHIAGLPVAVSISCWAHRTGKFEL
jgi:fumarate hydratase subunit alpha